MEAATQEGNMQKISHFFIHFILLLMCKFVWQSCIRKSFYNGEVHKILYIFQRYNYLRPGQEYWRRFTESNLVDGFWGLWIFVRKKFAFLLVQKSFIVNVQTNRLYELVVRLKAVFRVRNMGPFSTKSWLKSSNMFFIARTTKCDWSMKNLFC